MSKRKRSNWPLIVFDIILRMQKRDMNTPGAGQQGGRNGPPVRRTTQDGGGPTGETGPGHGDARDAPVGRKPNPAPGLSTMSEP